eukprot:CAMPEP_0170146328 /NCGR_PEP_ID=MMETSP0033_2-20121228/29618_1 /TAXON_ID=195969 /ORGANISM="Dolichomastix tenuilepis, Strain CCMP3274" /LENGTH=300 /DNA_ID=CAMNT_0010383043 /DNA_START=94 /DNA_END=992 /DNA_ORIENTATION=+
MATWLVGAGINICGSIGINFGTNLMKLGHTVRENAAEKEEDRPSITTIPAWRFGLGIFITGNIVNFLSFGFAAQSLLSALGSVQFVANCIFATTVNGETLTNRVKFGTFLIILGNIMLVFFGVQTSETYTAEEMKAFYRKPVYLIFLGGTLCVSMSCFFLYSQGRAMAAAALEKGHELSAGWRASLPATFALYSGIIGTNSVLFSKIMSTLLRTTFQGESQLAEWFMWVVLCAFIFTAVFWVAQGNRALAMFDALVIVPMLQIVWTTFSIFLGLVFFEEYKILLSEPGAWPDSLGLTVPA